MSNNDMNKTVREFYKAVEGVRSKKTGGYDVQATVRRVEDGVAWVHIPDGVDETPARLTINAKEGDVVQVRVVNGRAFLVGNASAPPTDNTEAIKALSQADIATQAATIAKLRADEATADAIRAHDAADSAQASADAAQDSADAAAITAGNAQASATTANTAANNALQGLSTVESVVDVVNWFNEHKTASTDTAVDPSKTYYSYDAQTGALTKLDPDGTEDPSALGWYEMSDAVADYVATHVATTADGLSVLSAANGWRVLISSGGGSKPAGIFLIDPNGNIAQQTTINGVEFNTGRAVKIGDQTAYINFDGNGNISVIGADLTIGGANNTSGQLTVKDALGNTIGTWAKDGIDTIAGTIGPFTITTDALYSGLLTIGTKENKYGITETAVRITGSQDEHLNSVLTNNRTGAQIYSELASNYYDAACFEVSKDSTVNPPRYKGRICLANIQDNTVQSTVNDRHIYLGIYDNQNGFLQVEGSLALYGGGGIPSELVVRGNTSSNNSYAPSTPTQRNPRIEFQNSGATQNIALIFTDYDTVQSPASLTLAGNQGGEYFIAPNIKCSELYLNGNETNVGFSKNRSNNSAVSLSAGGTGKTLATVDLEKGKWIVMCKVAFPDASATSYVRACFNTTGNSSGADMQIPSNSGASTTLNFTKFVNAASTTTYYLSASSYVARTIAAGNGQLWAVKIQ